MAVAKLNLILTRHWPCFKSAGHTPYWSKECALPYTTSIAIKIVNLSRSLRGLKALWKMIEQSIAQSVLSFKPLWSDWIEESAQEVPTLPFSAFPVRWRAQMWSFQRDRKAMFPIAWPGSSFWYCPRSGFEQRRTKITCTALDREGALINDVSKWTLSKQILRIEVMA